MAEEERNHDLPVTVCATCHGAGCPSCRGIGEAAFLDGRWVYWGRKIHTAAIHEARIEQAAKGLMTVLLIAFGVVGLTLVVLLLQEVGINRVAPWEIIPQLRGNGRLFVFALSLLTDVYLIYRIARSREVIGRIPRRSYEQGPSAPTSLPAEQVVALRANERLDIATTLSAEAMRALEDAWVLAAQFHAKELAPCFVFAAELSFRKITAIRARLGINEKKLINLLQQLLASKSQSAGTQPALGHEFRILMIAAYQRAFARRAAQVDVTDLFAAAAVDTEEVRDILDELAITPVTIENVVAWITIQDQLRRQWAYFRSRARFKPKSGMNRAMTAIATPLLDRYSNDLTALARAGLLHPCIARDKEIDGIFRLLEGGNSVLLVGNPGVGKTAIIEGIAQRMVTEDVPAVLQDKRLVSLSIATLVGSDSRGGGVEERFNYVLNEVARAGNIVLFLDNIQNLVGVGASGAATLDLSEMLGSTLANRHFLSLATSNPIDYRRYVEPSAGLSGHYSRVVIEEVDTNAAIQVLEAQSGMVEYEYHVYFSYGAIEKIVTLAKRYLHDRYLPEKAIMLMQEVAVDVHKSRGAHAVVNAEDVAKVVSEKTNIAVTAVTEEESTRLLHLEERIHERIIGQEEAVTAVASALRRARVELRDLSRPIVNLLFLGPTGVGKTELAKTVARVYFGQEENMIRLDMSEYQDAQSINRLIGLPPGYAGSTGGGYLTEAVRAQPFSLVLLDELEKAHPDILNLFLQVMDDGRLTDSAGRTIDFTNVILIATSNAGTEVIQDGLRAGQQIEAIKEQLIERELGRYFRPEFLNRFDQIVVFKPLTITDVVAVAKLLLHQVAQRLGQKGITLEASEAAVRELAQRGFDPLFGARPLRRLIQEEVDNALAKFLLTGKLGRRDRAILEPGGVIRVEEAPSVWRRTRHATPDSTS